MRSSTFVILGATAMVAAQCYVDSHAASNSALPVVNILSTEPTGLMDDSGVEMWMVTVGISNGLAMPNEPVYIRDANVSSIEARVERQWIRIEGQIGSCALYPLQLAHRVLAVVPEKADSVRIRFRYARARVISGTTSRLAEDLPASIRTNMPSSFWRTVGFVKYGPSSYWQEQQVELPLRLSSQSHNEPLQATPR